MTNTRTQSNLRLLKSRNQREGWYHGKFRCLEGNSTQNWFDIKPKHHRVRLKHLRTAS